MGWWSLDSTSMVRNVTWASRALKNTRPGSATGSATAAQRATANAKLKGKATATTTPAQTERSTSTSTDTPSANAAPPLLSLPDEIILYNVFEYLRADDIVVFGWVNRRLHRLAHDDAFWLSRIKRDLSVPRALAPEIYGTARPEAAPDTAAPSTSATTLTPAQAPTPAPSSGTIPASYFRRLYFGIAYPRVFVWGEWDMRIELEDDDDTTYMDHEGKRCVSRPMDITALFPRTDGLVNLKCSSGGHQYICRDSRGALRLWGRHVSPIPARIEGMGCMSDEAARRNGIDPADTFAVNSKGLLYVAPDGEVYQQLALFSWDEDGSYIQRTWYAPPTRVTPDWPAGTVKHVTGGGWDGAAVLADNTITVWNMDPERHADDRITTTVPTRDEWWARPDAATHDVSYRRDEWEAQWDAQVATARQNGWPLPSDKDDGERVARIDITSGRLVALKKNGEVWQLFVEFDPFRLDWHLMPDRSHPTNYDVQYYDGSLLVLSHADAWPRIQTCWGDEHWVSLTASGDVYSGGVNTNSNLARGRWPPGTFAHSALAAGKVEFPPDELGNPTRVFYVALRGALALGDGRLPYALGRGHGDAPPFVFKMQQQGAKRPPSKKNIVLRTRDRWREFKLLVDTLDEHLK